MSSFFPILFVLVKEVPKIKDKTPNGTKSGLRAIRTLTMKSLSAGSPLLGSSKLTLYVNQRTGKLSTVQWSHPKLQT